MNNKAIRLIQFFGGMTIVFSLLTIFSKYSGVSKLESELGYSLGPSPYIYEIGLIVCSIFVIKLNIWAKRVFLIITALPIVLGLITIIGLFFPDPEVVGLESRLNLLDISKALFAIFIAYFTPFLASLYFFTRKQIKAQFK